MKKLFVSLAACVLLFLPCSISSVLQPSATPNRIPLPSGVNEVKFRVLRENPRSDYFNFVTDAQSLADLSPASYSTAFGSVGDAETAARAAAVVHTSVYGDLDFPELPLVVYFNKNANAWIVMEQLPADTLGGVGEFAILKDTGKVIYVSHGK